MNAAPPAGAFAAQPASWQIFSPSRAVRDRPVSRDLFGRRLVAFRSGGKIAVIGGRCWHLGADLGGGELIDGCVACPFHGWRFDAAGRCVLIPAQREIPPTARQATYAAVERGGLIWAFPAGRPAFDLPFFEGVSPDELRFAPPFAFDLTCPWWMVGTNGFDVQHFAGAHDRRLVGDVRVTTPDPFARRVEATFAVVGRSWREPAHAGRRGGVRHDDRDGVGRDGGAGRGAVSSRKLREGTEGDLRVDNDPSGSFGRWCAAHAR